MTGQETWSRSARPVVIIELLSTEPKVCPDNKKMWPNNKQKVQI